MYFSNNISLQFDGKIIVNENRQKKNRFPLSVMFAYVKNFNSQVGIYSYSLSLLVFFTYCCHPRHRRRYYRRHRRRFLQLSPLFLRSPSCLFTSQDLVRIESERNFRPIDGNEMSRPWKFRHIHECPPLPRFKKSRCGPRSVSTISTYQRARSSILKRRP